MKKSRKLSFNDHQIRPLSFLLHINAHFDRSPAKSPQFKVPKNKQSGRGKKKVTSSKKLLFNEQKKMASSSFIVIVSIQPKCDQKKR